MKNNNVVKKYSARLVCEAALKSAFFGLVIGMALAFVASLIIWLVGANLATFLGILLGLAIGASAVAAVIFYFVKFRPTEKTIAARVDSLGLDERFITMLQYRDDESYIARRQREDAEAHLFKTSSKKIKFYFPKALLITLSCACVCAIAMSVPAGLVASGKLRTGVQAILGIDPDAINFTTVEYEADDGGTIKGESVQVVEKGTSTSTVTAVCEDGYAFVEWSDGYLNPQRDDVAEKDKTYVAYFEPVTEDPMDTGDEAQEPGDQTGNPSNSGPSSNAPSVLNPDGDSSSSHGKNPGGELAGDGDGESNNNVYDGETSNSSVASEAKSDASSNLSESGDNLSGEAGDVVNDYMNGAF